MHNKLNLCHGYVRPHQILYDKLGKIKLSLGISSKLSPEYKNSAIGMKQSGQGSLYDSETSDEVFSMYEKEMKNLIDNAEGDEGKLHYNKSADIFDLGLCLLLAVVGDNVLVYENLQDFYAD